MFGKSECSYNPESQKEKTESRPVSDNGKKNLNHKKKLSKNGEKCFSKNQRKEFNIFC